MLDDYEKKQQDLLRAIYTMTDGADQKAATMWDIGGSLGWERSETEDLAMELVGEGLLEIKSLSGALVLTDSGRARLDADGSAPGASPSGVGVTEFVDRMEAALGDWNFESRTRKDLEIDLAVLKLLEERSEPLPKIQKGILKEIAGTLSGSNIKDDLVQILDVLLEN